MSASLRERLPAVLLAVMVTLVVLAVTGVPEIKPVLAFNDSPAGSGDALYMIGAVPPEEVII